jgi:L-ascorbate metabolism protein UlaG (beta-lactamase superfamily)
MVAKAPKRLIRHRVLCVSLVSLASFALPIFVALALLVPLTAWAACSGPVADQGARLWHAAASGPEDSVRLTFLGHASFLIESPQGVRIVTDYNGVIRAPVTPDIVTMNNAHPTHYTDDIEPGVKFVLRGWDPAGGIATHHLDYRDVKIHNVPTNVREFGGTRYNGNSIFVFDVADLCLAHLGHLHHTLTPGHLADLGPIDVVLVPVDGGYTLNQPEMIEVLQQIKPKIAVPMHVFTQMTLERFLARAGEFYTVRRADDPSVVLTRATLPAEPEMLVLPGR